MHAYIARAESKSYPRLKEIINRYVFMYYWRFQLAPNQAPIFWAMNAPGSLRDKYSDNSSSWAFTPQPLPHSGKSSLPVAPEPGSSTRPLQWSNRPAHNSIFDLAPSLDLNEPAGISPADLFKTLLASAVLQYTSSAIAMPWEVGKLLLQVQWVPRDVGTSLEPDVEVPEDDVIKLYLPFFVQVTDCIPS